MIRLADGLVSIGLCLSTVIAGCATHVPVLTSPVPTHDQRANKETDPGQVKISAEDALLAEFKRLHGDARHKFKEQGKLVEAYDIVASYFESVYRETNNGDTKAYALKYWEFGLREKIRALGPKSKAVSAALIPGLKLDPEVRVSEMCTIVRKPEYENNVATARTYLLVFASADDAMSGRFRFGEDSTYRFSGTIPFPLQVDFLMSVPARWSDHEEARRYGITNSLLATGTPAANALVFEGDSADPLTVSLLKDFGLVYLHGRGSVRMSDGKIRQYPRN